jgi:ribosomal protein S21
MVRLEENENIDQALKRMDEESKQVLSFGESITRSCC